MERTEVSFISGGEQIAAWLYEPPPAAPNRLCEKGTRGLTPCVVMAHGLGGTREAGLPA